MLGVLRISIRYALLYKSILDLAVTLDGFIEGENGEGDWCSMDSVKLNRDDNGEKCLSSPEKCRICKIHSTFPG